MKAQCLEYAVCEKTIYNLIDAQKVPGVTNESLWEKRKRKKGRKSLCRQRKCAVDPGHGIGDRPQEAEERQVAGLWEIDPVFGGKGKGTAVLLTLTERKTRKQIIRKLKDRTEKAVARKQVQKIEDGINNYPRRILDFETAEERFIQELSA
ncbi:hypothetical protein PDESU_06092 [Pontiella desulfatans]|uniref:Integrase catalytic domain-containing protein n=2 Tax=Pontiella desulfatans TaxID=2750659 RepID=A0A6C2UE52_PONDE|nr:hypothetical protein PDESU_06092 [Pontiella desulfatans]